MTDDIITKRHPSVMTFYAQARELAEMFEAIAPNIRPPLAGRFFIEDKELSRRLSLHRRTLQNFRNANIIPYYKIGGKTIYDESEIEEWLNANFHAKY